MAKRGRPPKPEGTTVRKKGLTFPPAVLSGLEEDARAAGLSLSAYLQIAGVIAGELLDGLDSVGEDDLRRLRRVLAMLVGAARRRKVSALAALESIAQRFAEE